MLKYNNFFTSLVFVFISTQSLAANWLVVLQTENEITFSVDLSSLRKEGNTSKGWVMAEHSTPMPIENSFPKKEYIKRISFHHWKCDIKKDALMKIVSYAEDGGIADSKETTTEYYTEHIPDSAGDGILNKVCKLTNNPKNVKTKY